MKMKTIIAIQDNGGPSRIQVEAITIGKKTLTESEDRRSITLEVTTEPMIETKQGDTIRVEGVLTPIIIVKIPIGTSMQTTIKRGVTSAGVGAKGMIGGVTITFIIGERKEIIMLLIIHPIIIIIQIITLVLVTIIIM